MGSCVGSLVGSLVGSWETDLVGCSVGAIVGDSVSSPLVGSAVGFVEGFAVGLGVLGLPSVMERETKDVFGSSLLGLSVGCSLGSAVEGFVSGSLAPAVGESATRVVGFSVGA